MKQKIEITKKILELLQIEADERKIKKYVPIFWYSVRQKEKGGLRLTTSGFEAFCKADVKHYRIKFEEEIHFTNQLTIWLDNFIDCPFYLDKKGIYVFSEKMAVQLVLFSGNIYKFGAAKSRSLSN